MKDTTVLDTASANSKFLRCPLCNKSMRLKKFSFICKKNHCFDITAKGYLNFVPHQPQTIYDPTMFANKRAVYEAGFYDPVVAKLVEVATPFIAGQEKAISCLDAGCGEGFYSLALYNELKKIAPTHFFAMDIERNALKMAAPKSAYISWFVADINHIPLKKRGVDLLFNILTPANYAEFKRILTPHGHLIKIIPGRQYLQEIRTNVQDQLKSTAYDDTRVLEYFQKNCRNVKVHEIGYTLAVPPSLSAPFYCMTPMTQGLALDIDALPVLSEITIHFQILVGQFAP